MNNAILIYENNSNFNNINLNINKNINKNIIKYNKKIYLLYDAKYLNPPFFNKIIVLHNNLKIDDLKMIYNMTLINGVIIFLKKYDFFFKNNIKQINKNLYLFKKLNNIVYNFPYTRVVDFIIIGTQKGGTTALSVNIGKHPDIYIDTNPDPFKSEIHFFDLNWKKGIKWYKDHFNYSKKMVGEKTPDLMYLDYTFPLIQSINPYLKIVIILRDPIERAFSSWKLITKYFNERRTFEDAINDELNIIKNKLDKNENITFFTASNHYLRKGLYFKQIEKLLKWFPKDNLLILISENVIKNMDEEYNKVYKFFNIRQYTTKYDLHFVSDDVTKMDKNLYNKLIKFFKSDVKKLEKLIGYKLNSLK
jgi:hypothetical protein